MATTDLSATDVLRSVPLFSGMTDRSIATISELAQPIAFEAGATLVAQGDPGDTFIVITTGAATVEQDGQRIRDLGPGDFLGEISLIDGGPRTATVVATEPIDGLVIDCQGFRRLMDDFPVVRLDLVTALTERLRSRAPNVSD